MVYRLLEGKNVNFRIVEKEDLPYLQNGKTALIISVNTILSGNNPREKLRRNMINLVRKRSGFS